VAVAERSESIALLVAVRREADAVLKALPFLKLDTTHGQEYYQGTWRDRNIVLAALGIGLENARRGVQALIQIHSLSMMIALGFAGGLEPQAKTGTLILAEEIHYENETEPFFVCNPELLRISERFLRESGIPLRVGKIVTVSAPLCTAEKKREIGRQQGFLAVDMESAALAEAARAEGVPLLCFRVILDEVQDHFRLDPHRINKNGKLSLPGVLKTLTMNPALIPDFIRLNYLWSAAGKSIQRAIIPVLRGILGE
jgi:adenosylhomocysteine nucleosidase